MAEPTVMLYTSRSKTAVTPASVVTILRRDGRLLCYVNSTEIDDIPLKLVGVFHQVGGSLTNARSSGFGTP